MRLTLIAVVIVITAASAMAGVYYVPATADIYLAGQPAGTVLQDTYWGQSDSTAGQSAFEVAGTTLTPGTRLKFSASGSSTIQQGVVPSVGPDGASGQYTSYNPSTGVGILNGLVSNYASPVPFALSGHSHIQPGALIGVFTSDDVPVWGTSSVLPASLDFWTIGMNFSSLSPELRQVFFIGDGTTSSGTAQEFVVPTGATHLFLAIDDGPGVYFNNGGGYTVEVQTVPEPSACAGLLLGFGTVLSAIRKMR